MAAEVLAGLPVTDTVAIADRTEAEPARHEGPEPLYEQWRSRIRAQLTAVSETTIRGVS
jgi:hypothetical protein